MEINEDIWGDTFKKKESINEEDNRFSDFINKQSNFLKEKTEIEIGVDTFYTCNTSTIEWFRKRLPKGNKSYSNKLFTHYLYLYHEGNPQKFNLLNIYYDLKIENCFLIIRFDEPIGSKDAKLIKGDLNKEVLEWIKEYMPSDDIIKYIKSILCVIDNKIMFPSFLQS